MSQSFDSIVIGTGQSGPSLAERISGEGLSVAVVERHLFGGTCVNVGCVPTKTMVASARAAYMARRAADFGVIVPGEVTVDMKKVKARKDEIAGASNKGVTGWMKGLGNGTVLEGHARFEAPNAVRVNGDLLTADRIFINAGARAFVPNIPGLSETPFLTNSGMMELEELPEHLIIMGGSYIGLEFGQMFRRFGSRVTIIERAPNLIPREDGDVVECVQEILSGEDVGVMLSTEVTRVSGTAGQIKVEVKRGGEILAVNGSHLLVAVGRRPNTDDLGVEKAGIALDERGFIQVDDSLRTNVPGIWAIGDINGKGAFTHTSFNDHEIVAANLFDKGTRGISDRITCYGLFIDPPLGRVGMTEQQARQSGRRVLVGKRMMARVGRARERGETHGFIKIMVDADTQQILGAAILGINGDEVVHSLLDIMYAGAPYTVIRNAVHIHPTVSELIPTVLGDLKPLA